MGLQVRRVVTGHDGDGRSVVKIDEVSNNIISRRSGHESCVVWSTEGFPVDNEDDEDIGAGQVGTAPNDGTVFRIVRYESGVAPRMHRTDSIDYAVVLSGGIDMELDDGAVVSLAAGDVLVQRGTIHSWVNHGPDPCVMAFVLVSAEEVTVDGRTLAPEG